MAFPAGLTDLLGPYLGRQRWYAGAADPPARSLELVDSDCLALAGGGARRLHWAIVEIDGIRYQLLIGEEPSGGPDRPGQVVLGTVGPVRFYDAVHDAELMLGLYERVVRSSAARVRLVGAEQSNTSLVFDDRVIVKVYRRLAPGVNPEIEVTSALAGVGFAHIAEPVAMWRADGVDLAFAQRFLAGGVDGWALALESLQELCTAGSRAPGSVPADFGPEAARLGQVTAQLHVALARAFPVDPDRLPAGWPAFVDHLEAGLGQVLGPGAALGPEEELGPEEGLGPEDGLGLGEAVGGLVAEVIGRLRAVRHPGPALRLHGDYHLGQVMRADGDWYVLDFEGEPARSLEERARPSSAAKDVSGMLRSIDYAARFALRGRDPDQAGDDEASAAAWERHNRAAFLQGYDATPGIEALMAVPSEAEAVLAAFELDKALYELRYERAYRPDWVDIPRAAISRIVTRLA